MSKENSEVHALKTAMCTTIYIFQLDNWNFLFFSRKADKKMFAGQKICPQNLI